MEQKRLRTTALCEGVSICSFYLSIILISGIKELYVTKVITRSLQNNLTNILRYSNGEIVSVKGRNLIVNVSDDNRHVGRHDVVAESGFVFKNLASSKLERVETALRKNCLKIC